MCRVLRHEAVEAVGKLLLAAGERVRVVRVAAVIHRVVGVAGVGRVVGELVLVVEPVDRVARLGEEQVEHLALGFTTRQRVERIPVPGLAAVPYSGLKLEYLLCYDSGRAVSEVDAAFLDFMRGKARFFW